MKTPIKEVPKGIRGLWKIQYQPVEEQIISEFKKAGKEDELKKWRKFSITKKIMIIDRLVSEFGFLDSVSPKN